MKLLVLYDITSDPMRVEAAEICKDFGLERVQYSCFAGDLSLNRRDMLGICLTELLQRHDAEPTDKIYLLPLCETCFDGRVQLGQPARFPDKRVHRFVVM